MIEVSRQGRQDGELRWLSPSHVLKEAGVETGEKRHSLVALKLHTGRTHQIRAHFAHIGCPVVGDDLYSRSSREFYKFGLLLLAARLGFHHPVTGKEMEFELPEPDRFLDFARKAEFY